MEEAGLEFPFNLFRGLIVSNTDDKYYGKWRVE